MSQDSSRPFVSGIAELTLEAHDLDATVSFYEQLLGLELLSRDR